jgi:hypothetical protein
MFTSERFYWGKWNPAKLKSLIYIATCTPLVPPLPVSKARLNDQQVIQYGAGTWNYYSSIPVEQRCN